MESSKKNGVFFSFDGLDSSLFSFCVIREDYIHLIENALAALDFPNDFFRNPPLIILQLHNFDDLVVYHVDKIVHITFVDKGINAEVKQLLFSCYIVDVEKQLFLRSNLSGTLILFEKSKAVLI